MADTRFADLTERAQVHRLRQTAVQALAQFGVQPTRLALLEHGFNTSFRVDTAAGQRFAMRISVNSHFGPDHVVAEVAWLEALARETDLWVPVPQRTADGELLARVHQPDLDRELSAVLMSWLPGRDVGDAVSVEKLHATGVAMATLHRHGSTWQLPPGGALPRVNAVLMELPAHELLDHPAFVPDQRSFLQHAFDRCQELLMPVFAAPVQPIHGDLHLWNTKWYRGRLSVFDFDDAGIGVPLQDLAIARYYLGDDTAQEAALFEGYASVLPVPQHTAEQLHALLAARNIVLLHTVLETTNPEFQAMVSRYVPNTVRKLKAWLDSGVYRHQIPGLIPLD